MLLFNYLSDNKGFFKKNNKTQQIEIISEISWVLTGTHPVALAFSLSKATTEKARGLVSQSLQAAATS